MTPTTPSLIRRLIRAFPKRWTANAFLWSTMWIMPILVGLITREFFDGRRRGVGEAHTERCQKAGKYFCEAVRKGRSRLVGLAKQVDVRSAEIRRGKILYSLLHHIRYLFTELDTMQSPPDVSGISHLKTDQFVRSVDDVRVVCLIPVMILRGHPEHGEHGPGQ